MTIIIMFTSTVLALKNNLKRSDTAKNVKCLDNDHIKRSGNLAFKGEKNYIIPPKLYRTKCRMSIVHARKKFLVLATLLSFKKGAQSAEDPRYVVEIERFEPCSEYKNLESPIENVKFLKINRTTRVFSFTSDMKRPMDESIGLKAELEKWGTRGWIQLPFMAVQADACNVFKKLLGKLWDDFVSSMGVQNPRRCPIPAGRYSMANYTYDTSDLGYFAPFKGKFRYKTILVDMKSGKAVQCISVVINVADSV